MMKSVRLFNANTLFKVSLAMIVMVAAIYDIRLVCFGTKIIFLQAKSL